MNLNIKNAIFWWEWHHTLPWPPSPLCHTLSLFWPTPLPPRRVAYFLNGPQHKGITGVIPSDKSKELLQLFPPWSFRANKDISWSARQNYKNVIEDTFPCNRNNQLETGRIKDNNSMNYLSQYARMINLLLLCLLQWFENFTTSIYFFYFILPKKYIY